MPAEFWSLTGDIHEVFGERTVGLMVTFASVLCGAMIGIERERARKPAGIRTMILICLGSAIFTQASILMAGSTHLADRSRIAAQIVTGIGFLGAGAIIHERGSIIGITTGAGIWATSAVGVMLGSGYVAAGVVFAVIIRVTLAAARWFERVMWGPCQFTTVEVTYEAADGKARIEIEAILDEFVMDDTAKFLDAPDGRKIATIRYCHTHFHHRAFLSAVAALKGVTHIRRELT